MTADEVGRELLGEFLGEQARGAGFKNLLQESMCNAFQHEIADDEARHDFDTRRIQVHVLLDRPVEQLAVQKDQRNVAGLVEHPPGLCVRRQDAQMSRRPAAADPSALQRALQPHLRAVIDAERGSFERRQADIHLAHAKARRGHAAPSALGADERHLRSSERVDELQRCPLRANQLALRHHTPEMHAVRRNGADNGLEMQINGGFDKDSQDSGNRVADVHRKIQHDARG